MIIKWIRKVVYLLIVLLASVMIFSVLSSVLFRFILHKSCYWGDELARYSMIWAGLLGISASIREGMTIGVDFFIQKMPIRIRNVLFKITWILCAFFLILAIHQGVIFTSMFKYQLSPALKIPMIYIYSAIPIGFVVSLLDVVEKIFSNRK